MFRMRSEDAGHGGRGLASRETAQVAGRTAKGVGGPRTGICGCSEGCWQHAPDRPDQNEAARHGSGEDGEGERREGGKATNSPPSCTASKRVPAQGLSTPAKCTRGAPRHSIPLFKRRKPRIGRKRARRQGRPSRPRSDEDRGARREADVARRAAATVHYQPSSLRNLQSETGRRDTRTSKNPQEAPPCRAATTDPSQPEATSHVPRTRRNARERGGGRRGRGGRERIQGLPPGPT